MMGDQPIAIRHTGLVTSVGLSAAASCAAIRAGISNASETRFIDAGGEPIIGHQVALESPWSGTAKLLKMAEAAMHECLQAVPPEHWCGIPVLACVAESGRPGCTAGLERRLLPHLETTMQVDFPAASRTFAEGKVAVARAIEHARRLLYDDGFAVVLVLAVDSLLDWESITAYQAEGRLLTSCDADGFLPGEAAGALLLGRDGHGGESICAGLGFALETATPGADLPLRGDGLALAFRRALADAGLAMHEIDHRIADVSGEQYYFREADLALSRTLRRQKNVFDLWHPADCVGEVGAAAGAIVLCVADAAFRKGYGPGPRMLAHFSGDDGQRAAIVLQAGGPA
jgi:3-oxoacyl-[acyl-carrier-protein] synthase-1